MDKLYGASILNNDEREEDLNGDEFPKVEYDNDEINEMRDELKSSSTSGIVKEKVFTDSISGIKSSEKMDSEEPELSEIIDSKEKKGKSISTFGLDLIENLLGSKADEDDIRSIEAYFKTIQHKDDIYAADSDKLKVVLGNKIVNKLSIVANENNMSEYSVIIKFISELYKSYITIVQYNDDVNELYDLVTNVNNMMGTKDDKSNDSMETQLNTLYSAIEKLKKLDERNKKLKNDYTINDFDILMIDSVKECLSKAISFENVHNKIDNLSTKKIKKMSNDEMIKSISNWVNDIKNDPDTLYTFPVNDYLSLKESVEELINYIKGFILIQDNFNEYSDTIDVDNVESFMDTIPNNDMKNYYNSAVLFLYVLSKTFKKKKIKDNDDRRILSYTLDIISKSSLPEYSEKIMKVINNISEKFLNISYNYFKTNN